jgi:hypothetical protein
VRAVSIALFPHRIFLNSLDRHQLSAVARIGAQIGDIFSLLARDDIHPTGDRNEARRLLSGRDLLHAVAPAGPIASDAWLTPPPCRL